MPPRGGEFKSPLRHQQKLLRFRGSKAPESLVLASFVSTMSSELAASRFKRSSPAAVIGVHLRLDETERVTGRVQEYSPLVRAWLAVRFRCPEGQNGALTGVEVVNVEVKMGLLRRPIWPSRRDVVGVSLEAQVHS